MLLQELYDYFGSWALLTKELELSANSYQNWRRRGYIPYPTQLVIERKSKGIFKANEAQGRPVAPKRTLKNIIETEKE